MKKHILIIISILFLVTKLNAQVGINSTNTPPDPKAMLDVSSGTKGMLIPRMTAAQKAAIAYPVPIGLMVYDQTINQFSYYNGSAWIDVSGANGSTWTVSGNDIYNVNLGNVTIASPTPNPFSKFEVTNSLASGNGIQGNSTGLNGIGIYGRQTNGGYGVLGEASGGNAIGGYFIANGGTQKALKAETIAGGTAAYFTAPGSGGKGLIVDQGSVGIGTTTPDPSAKLEVNSTDKGFLLPRMTTAQRVAIASPSTGLMVFDTDTQSFWAIQGGIWINLKGNENFWTRVDSSNNITNINSGNIGIGLNDPSTKIEIARSSRDVYYGRTGLKFRTPNGYINFNNSFETGTNSNESLNDGKPTDFAVDKFGIIYLVYQNLNKIVKIDQNGDESTFYTGSSINQPQGIEIGPDNNIYVTNISTNTVTKITRAGVASIYATGFNQPFDLVFKYGNMYVTNLGNGTISKVNPQGNVITHSFASGLNLPTSITQREPLSTFFVSNYGTNQILSINEQSGASNVVLSNISSSDINVPNRSGSLYVASFNSTGQPQPLKYLASGGLTSIPGVVTDNFKFDQSNNLYFLEKRLNPSTNTFYYVMAIRKSFSGSILTVSSEGDVEEKSLGFCKNESLFYLSNTDGNTPEGRNNFYQPNGIGAKSTDGKAIYGITTNGFAGHFTGKVYSSGSMGIGTENPIAKLHVVGTGSPLFVNNGQYFGNTGGFAPYSGVSNAPFGTSSAIFADGSIATNSFIGSYQTVVSSDNRIKNIISLSNNSEDLERLNKIEITNYRMKDVATWGNQTFKKVIAQQVESVYPEVIKKQTQVIPDIYTLAESVVYDALNKKLSISTLNDYGIKSGDKVELVHPEKGKIQAEVVEVSGKSFTVKDWQYPTDKIFVFGREVNDFRSVDYEALSMLGISAIQALAKEIEVLKNQNIQLKSDFNKRLETIEASLKLNTTSSITK